MLGRTMSSNSVCVCMCVYKKAHVCVRVCGYLLNSIEAYTSLISYVFPQLKFYIPIVVALF
jgi:hypothetical protein